MKNKQDIERVLAKNRQEEEQASGKEKNQNNQNQKQREDKKMEDLLKAERSFLLQYCLVLD
jgi:hypothetical protein